MLGLSKLLGNVAHTLKLPGTTGAPQAPQQQQAPQAGSGPAPSAGGLGQMMGNVGQAMGGQMPQQQGLPPMFNVPNAGQMPQSPMGPSGGGFEKLMQMAMQHRGGMRGGMGMPRVHMGPSQQQQMPQQPMPGPSRNF